MTPHYRLLRKLSTRKSNRDISLEVFSWGVCDCASHSCSVFLSAPTIFCKVCSVIIDPIHFSGIFFSNFQFVYAYRNFTDSLHDGRVDFSVLFYIVTNLRKPRQTHVTSRGHYCSTFGYNRPTETWVKMAHWYFNWLDWPISIHEIV